MLVNVATSEELDVVLGENKKVMVDVYADWCGPCKQIAPILDDLAEHGNVIVKINVDDAPDIAQKYGIRGVPTLMVFEGGEVKETKVGSASKSDIEMLLS